MWIKSEWSDGKASQAVESTFSFQIPLTPTTEFLLRPQQASIFKANRYGVSVYCAGLEYSIHPPDNICLMQRNLAECPAWAAVIGHIIKCPHTYDEQILLQEGEKDGEREEDCGKHSLGGLCPAVTPRKGGPAPLLAGYRKKMAVAQHSKCSHELKMSSSYSSGSNWLEQISN